MKTQFVQGTPVAQGWGTDKDGNREWRIKVKRDVKEGHFIMAHKEEHPVMIGKSARFEGLVKREHGKGEETEYEFAIFPAKTIDGGELQENSFSTNDWSLEMCVLLEALARIESKLNDGDSVDAIVTEIVKGASRRYRASHEGKGVDDV